MIVTRSHFKGLIHIPNIEDNAPNSDLLGNRSELQLFINECEREASVKALGPFVYNELLSNLNAAGDVIVSAPEKWKELRNGKEYVKDGCKKYWRGLSFIERGTPISAFAYYVFWYFLESDLSRYSGTGVVSEKTKNAKNADPTWKALRAWRKFYKMVVKSDTLDVALYEFISDMNDLDSSTYPDWSGYDFKPRNFASI